MAKNRVFLLPGEYHVTRTATELATLLGSCVSVCLWHARKKYAAMNHFLLADPSAGKNVQGRYGESATEAIIWLMKKLAADTRPLQAKIYGGAAVVSHLSQGGNIGAHNIQVAREILSRHRIPITEEDVGGTTGRRIYFDSSTGKVQVKRIHKTEEVKRLVEKRRDLATRATRVLIVDDSALVRKILRQAVESTPDMEVCGEAEDAFEARDLILTTDPDVISLDIIMPKIDGLKFLKSLSEHYPKPVVICSTIAKDKSAVAKRAREYGAVDVVDKEKLELYKGLETVRKEYIPKLKFAAAKVVRKKIFGV